MLGQHALVKVVASAATLAQVAALPGVDRLPADRLDDPLSALTVAQRNALRDRITGLGYSVAELDAALPGTSATAPCERCSASSPPGGGGCVLTPTARRFIDDGPEQPVRPLEDADGAIA